MVALGKHTGDPGEGPERAGRRTLWWVDCRGVSLVEILIGVVILAMTLLGLVASGVIAARQIHIGRLDMSRWSAVQEQLESMHELPWDSLTSGSDVVQGYPISWTVAESNPNKTKQVRLMLSRENNAGQMVEDTMIMYVTKR